MPRVSELQSTPALASGDLVYVVADGVSSKLASLRVANVAAMVAIAAPANGMSVEVVEAGRAGLFVFDTSVTAAGNNGTTFSATDATTGSWVRRFGGNIYGAWFGLPTGGNDTAMAMAAITAAATAGVAADFTGLTLNPETVLELPSNAHVIGGTWIKPANGVRFITNSAPIAGNANITLERIVFDGNDGSFGGANGIFFDNVTNLRITGCTIKDLHSATTGTIKFLPLDIDSCTDVWVTDNWMKSPARSGVVIRNISARCIIANNIIDTVENTGISVIGTNTNGTNPSTVINITGNVIRNAHCGAFGTGVQLYNQDGAIDVYQGGDRVIVANNLIDGFGIFGVDEQADPGGTAREHGYGIRLAQTQGGVVSNNVLVTGAKFDVALYAGVRDVTVASKGIVWSNNTVMVRHLGRHLCFTAQAAGHWVGNTFIADAAAAEYTVAAFRVSVAADNLIIVDNRFEVPAELTGTPAVLLAAGGTNVKISGNIIVETGRGVDLPTGQTLSNSDISENNIVPAAGGQYGVILTGIAEDCRIAGNTIEGAPLRGLRFSDARRSIISGNHITLSGGHGIEILAGERCLIEGNTVHSSNTAGGSTDNINVTANRCLIQGNMIWEGTQANKPRYGIRINATSTGCAVLNNFALGGGATGDISDAGTSTVTASANIIT